ncbi:MAG: 4-hydroxythreonine-4-phosphate dehydrogenase PdxA [Kiritimatiellia bacterium]
MSDLSNSPSGKTDPRTVLAVTLGDAGGIGPETALRAALSWTPSSRLSLVLIGSRSVADAAAELIGAAPLPAWSPGGAFAPVCLWESGQGRVKFTKGHPSVGAARDAAAWIETAVEGCLCGLFQGMVTAPICKEGFKKAGIPYPGHTEMLAALTGAPRFAMMLAGGPLRVVLATRHLALTQVPAAVTREAIREAVELTWESLPWLGFPRGKVAVCALNPHAGDGGLLGREEGAVIGPEICALRRRGLDVEGPVPADVVFYQARQGRYAAVVAMYHDQGLGPLKMLAFDRGINVTLGLPIVRTSPDHGTAFDVAWTGKANPRSMIEALRLAVRLARRPNPWRLKKGRA